MDKKVIVTGGAGFITAFKKNMGFAHG